MKSRDNLITRNIFGVAVVGGIGRTTAPVERIVPVAVVGAGADERTSGHERPYLSFPNGTIFLFSRR